MGQLVEWREVVTGAVSLEECRRFLQGALNKTIAACRQLGREIPQGRALLEQARVDLGDVRQVG